MGGIVEGLREEGEVWVKRRKAEKEEEWKIESRRCTWT